MANTRGTFLLEDWSYHRPPGHAFGENLPDNIYQNGVISVNSADYTGTRQIVPGSVFETWDGKVFKYVEAAAACAEGDLLQWTSTAATAAATSSSDSTIVTVTAAGVLENQYRGGYIIADSTTPTVNFGMRRIAANSAANASNVVTVYMERAAGANFASTGTALLVHPYRVSPTSSGAKGTGVSGVSYGTITAPVSSGWYAGGTSYGGWMQVSGLCESVKVLTATLAGAAGQSLLLIPSSTGGTAIQITSTDAAGVVTPFATLAPWVRATTGTGKYPAFLFNCCG